MTAFGEQLNRDIASYEELVGLLSAPVSVAVAGRPMTGKTTLANKLAADLSVPCVHTDDYIGATSFDGLGDAALSDVSKHDQFIVEGVMVARMLKSGFAPADVVIMQSYAPISGRHRGLASMSANAINSWLDASPQSNIFWVRLEDFTRLP